MGFTEADRQVADAQRARQNMTPAQASRNAAAMRNGGSKLGKDSKGPKNAMGSQQQKPTMKKSQQQTSQQQDRQQGPQATKTQLPAEQAVIPAKPTPEFRFPGISLQKQKEIEARGLKILQDAAKHRECLCEKPCNCEGKKMDPKKEISGLPDLDCLYNLGGPEFGKMKHARDYEGLSQALMKIMQNPKFIKVVQDQVNGSGTAPKGAKGKQLSSLEWQEILGMNQYLNGGKKTPSKTPPTKSKGTRNVPDPSRGQMVQPATTKGRNPQGGRPQGAPQGTSHGGSQGGPQRGPHGQLSTNNVPMGGRPQQAGGARPQARQAQGTAPRRA